MNKKTISLILLAVFILTSMLTVANMFLDTNYTNYGNKNGTLNITDSKTNQTKTVHYQASGKCINIIDGDTIEVYGVGKVQLVQIDTPEKSQPGYDESKNFVSDRCMGKIVYLDIDDKEPKDKYDRTLAIVYTEKEDINKELLNNNLAKELYIPPSEFEKGKI